MIHNQFDQPAEYNGVALPKAANTLLNIAALSGWVTAWQWQEDSDGSPFVTVHVGDRESGEMFKYIWHSRGSANGTLRKSGPGHYTPFRGHVGRDAPSLKAATFRMREVHAQRS